MQKILISRFQWLLAVGVEAAKSQSQAHAGAQMLHISNAASTFPPTIRQPEGAAKVQRNESD